MCSLSRMCSLIVHTQTQATLPTVSTKGLASTSAATTTRCVRMFACVCVCASVRACTCIVYAIYFTYACTCACVCVCVCMCVYSGGNLLQSYTLGHRSGKIRRSKGANVTVRLVCVWARARERDWEGGCCQRHRCVKRDLVCVRRNLVCVNRDLVCVTDSAKRMFRARYSDR